MHVQLPTHTHTLLGTPGSAYRTAEILEGGEKKIASDSYYGVTAYDYGEGSIEGIYY